MARLVITPEDMKARLILDANWYPVRITSVTQERNKKGDADNIIVDLLVLHSDDPDKDRFEECTVRRYFSEKAAGMAINFIEACGGSVDEEAGGEFDLSSATGKTIEAYIRPRNFENREINDAVDFRAPQPTEA